MTTTSTAASLTELCLQVPTESAGCTKWISHQEPADVVEALTLAELLFNAVKRERFLYVRRVEGLDKEAKEDESTRERIISYENSVREIWEQLRFLKDTLCTADQEAVQDFISRMETMAPKTQELCDSDELACKKRRDYLTWWGSIQ